MWELVELLLPRITFDPLVKLEALAVVVAAALAFLRPRLGRRWFGVLERRLGHLARRRGLAVISAGAFVVVLRLLAAPALPPHAPAVHDEFSYLLAAETFASGRLTNPTHPMWRHFESFHIIHRPTYTSMYPVAPALFLAAGKALFGTPRAGVILGVALLCAALCWMLQGWLPPRWALLGALVAAIRLGAFSHWMNSYWGGAVAALGGALVLGALARILTKPRRRDGLWLGLGLALLANSRPYEGFLLAMGAGFVLGVRWWRAAPDWRRAVVGRVAPPALLLLAATGLMMTTYFRRVTGDPWKLPYLVNRQTYAVAPLFLWQSPAPAPPHRHEAMRWFYLDWEPSFQYAGSQRTFSGYTAAAALKLRSILSFYYGPVLLGPLLLLPWVIRGRRMRPLAAVAAVCAAGSAVQVYLQPHYIAPATGLLYLFLMQALRLMAARPAGRSFARAIPAICVLMLVAGALAGPLGIDPGPPWPLNWARNSPVNLERARLLDELARTGERHLVVVRYDPGHDVLRNEWVYNEPEIDAAPVVWAREMDAANNRELLGHFRGRKVWLLEPGRIPPRLSPYPAAAGQ